MYLLGITGIKQSGKDTLCEHLQKLLAPNKIVRLAFADEVYREVAMACGVTIEFIKENKPLFRTMLQWWGTDFRRKLFGDEYWIKKWMIAANRESMSRNTYCLVVTDVRFLNEAKLIKDLGGKLIRIYRSDAVSNDQHQSEIELQDIKPDYIIHNQYDIPQLHQNTVALLNKLREEYLNGNKYHTSDTSKSGIPIIHPTKL
jgi:dephospho-CoA kinase